MLVTRYLRQLEPHDVSVKAPPSESIKNVSTVPTRTAVGQSVTRIVHIPNASRFPQAKRNVGHRNDKRV